MSCQELASASEKLTDQPVFYLPKCWLDKDRKCDKSCVAYNNERIPCKFIERLDAIVTILEEWQLGDYKRE